MQLVFCSNDLYIWLDILYFYRYILCKINIEYWKYITGSNMIARKLSEAILNQKGKYPIVTVTGPRQSGKTTICRQLFPDLPYFNLERPDIRQIANNDPQTFLIRCSNGAIIDEIQHVPELLSYLQVLVDDPAFNGFFVLTGSRNFAFMEQISQSLAGRTAVFTLLPFSMTELAASGIRLSLEKQIFNGFYPRIYDKGIESPRFYADYVATYIERDLRQLSMVKDLSLFQRFVELVAARTGQVINLESVGNDCGVSQPTVRRWLSLLEANWLIFKLPPFYRNINKRLIKHSKFYFCDVGLVCYLLGITSASQLETHPLRGYLFENLVVTEIFKQQLNKGERHNLMFFRDTNGNEVDLLIPGAATFTAIEIKSARTFSSSFLKGLQKFNKLVPEEVREFVVYAGSERLEMKGTKIVSFTDLDELA
jgi:uncharacterized protein